MASAAKDAFGTAAQDAEKTIGQAAEACGLSFSADTLVATPNGEQTISTLNVGDHVQSYDPATKKVTTQTVQQVFINHDNDLMDVTLSVDSNAKATTSPVVNTKQHDAEVKSHGSLAPPATIQETVHTTQKHPWLTTTKGWIMAGELHIGDHVQRLDGTTATVVSLHVVPGVQDMYDLTVSNVHTFTVGNKQFIVHNSNGACGVSPGEVDSYGKLTYRQTSGDGLQLHHMPSDKAIAEFGLTQNEGAVMAIPDALHAQTRTFRWRNIKIVQAVKDNLAAGVSPRKVFRDELAKDIWDLHGDVPNSQLRQVIGFWRVRLPQFF